MAEAQQGAPQTITDLLVGTVGRDPEARLFSIPDSFGGWFDLSGAEVLGRVRSLAKGLVAAELRQGDTLAVLSSSRYETTVLDLAAAGIGVAVAPLKQSASQAQLQARLESVRARAVVVETVRDFARVDELQGDLPLVADVWQIGLGDLDKLAELGRTVADLALDERIAAVSGDSPALVPPAASDDDEPRGSGSQDRAPRTQAELVDRALALVALADGTGALGESDSAVLQTLPATDDVALVTTLAAVASGARLGHLPDPARLVEALGSFRPTLVVGYPDTFAAVESATAARAEQAGRGPALRQALDVAVEYARAKAAGSATRGLKTRYAVADTLVLKGLRKAVGGRVRAAVSIGTVDEHLADLMRGLDVVPLTFER